MMMKTLAILFTAFSLSTPGHATVRCQSLFSEKSLAFASRNPLLQFSWLVQQANSSSQKVLENISPGDTAPGAVIAARSRNAPNYYFHWIRDAALAIESLQVRMLESSDPTEKNLIDKKILEYVSFSEKIQKLPTLSGLGEPKFNVDGTAFSDPWGRPQNDGPALRALSIIHIFKNSKGATGSPAAIKMDLDYVAKHWQEPSFDLWEEVMANHFYNRMVQRRALAEGAEFAQGLGDKASATLYLVEKNRIEKSLLDDFWNQDGTYIKASSQQVGGLEGKNSNLDIAVVLGVLHGNMNDGLFRFSDPKFLSTLQTLENTFKSLYSINNNPTIPGVAIGRYPEDTFAGPDRSGGNPWVLATLALAEAYYRAAAEMKAANSSDWQKFVSKGDLFVARVNYHANPDGSLSEQMQRDTGEMTSANDLTWSHAAILTALSARTQVLSTHP